MGDSLIRVVSWNLNAGRGLPARKLVRVCAALEALSPDVLLVQELTADPATRGRFAQALAHIGLRAFEGPRPVRLSYGSALACRWPLQDPARDLQAPFPELVARAKAVSPHGAISCTSVHAPNGSNHGWKKIDTFESVLAEVSTLPERQFVVSWEATSTSRWMCSPTGRSSARRLRDACRGARWPSCGDDGRSPFEDRTARVWSPFAVRSRGSDGRTPCRICSSRRRMRATATRTRRVTAQARSPPM